MAAVRASRSNGFSPFVWRFRLPPARVDGHRMQLTGGIPLEDGDAAHARAKRSDVHGEVLIAHGGRLLCSRHAASAIRSRRACSGRWRGPDPDRPPRPRSPGCERRRLRRCCCAMRSPSSGFGWPAASMPVWPASACGRLRAARRPVAQGGAAAVAPNRSVPARVLPGAGDSAARIDWISGPVARGIVEADLGASIEHYFDEFDDRAVCRGLNRPGASRAAAPGGRGGGRQSAEAGRCAAVRAATWRSSARFVAVLRFVRFWPAHAVGLGLRRAAVRDEGGNRLPLRGLRHAPDAAHAAAPHVYVPRVLPALLVAARAGVRVHPRRADGGLRAAADTASRSAVRLAARERHRPSQGGEAAHPLALPPDARGQPLSRRSAPGEHPPAAEQPRRPHRLRCDQLHRAGVPAEVPPVHAGAGHARLREGRRPEPHADGEHAGSRSGHGEGRAGASPARLGHPHAVPELPYHDKSIDNAAIQVVTILSATSAPWSGPGCGSIAR